VASSFKHSNWSLGFVKCREFFDSLMKIYLLNKHSAEQNWALFIHYEIYHNVLERVL
jgi:hypothetical protein